MFRPKTVSLEEGCVKVEWNDGHVSVFANKRLREACPCALCQGEAHPFGVPRVLPMVPEVPLEVRATAYGMVGMYAITFVWSDGHRTGIYPYDLLLELCECERCAGISA